MKRLLLASLLVIGFSISGKSQVVNLKWMQHAFRWLNTSNFPGYTTQKTVQDSILYYTGIELKKHFKKDSVQLPSKIDYREIIMFGSPKISEPEPSTNQEDIDVSILSFLTRATTGFAVKFKMQIIAKQHGEELYSRSVEHELEYYSQEGYLTGVKWFSEDEFVQLYTSLISELLENRAAFPSKITIGSLANKEKELKKLALENDSIVEKMMPQSEKKVLKTNGNFLAANSFILSLQNDHADTISSVTYKDGWEASWPKIDMSHATADFFKGLTGIDWGYQSKSKEKRYGRLNFANGREVRLRIEWLALTNKYTDGSIGSSKVISPMVLEAFEEKDMIAYFTYYGRTEFRDSLQGKIGDLSITAAYNANNKLIEVTENGKLKVIVALQDLNPISNSKYATKLSKNKIFVTSTSNSLSAVRFKEPEMYSFYHVAGLTEQEITRYLDAVLCLFFGMGNKY